MFFLTLNGNCVDFKPNNISAPCQFNEALIQDEQTAAPSKNSGWSNLGTLICLVGIITAAILIRNYFKVENKEKYIEEEARRRANEYITIKEEMLDARYKAKDEYYESEGKRLDENRWRVDNECRIKEQKLKEAYKETRKDIEIYFDKQRTEARDEALKELSQETAKILEKV